MLKKHYAQEAETIKNIQKTSQDFIRKFSSKITNTDTITSASPHLVT